MTNSNWSLSSEAEFRDKLISLKESRTNFGRGNGIFFRSWRIEWALEQICWNSENSLQMKNWKKKQSVMREDFYSGNGITYGKVSIYAAYTSMRLSQIGQLANTSSTLSLSTNSKYTENSWSCLVTKLREQNYLWIHYM